MKKLLTYSCSLLSAGALYAETVWLGTVEVSSLQSLQTGIEAFCKAADIPLPPDAIKDVMKDFPEEVLEVPNLDIAAVSDKDPIRLFLVVDSEERYPDPAFVVEMTLTADAKAIELPEGMALAIKAGNKAVLTTSKEAAAWYQKQDNKLDAFLPMAGTQTVKGCFNLKQVMKLIGEDFPPMPGGEANPAIAMLKDFEYLSFALTPAAQALTVSYGLRLKEGTLLANLLNAVTPPQAPLWNGLPENALFAYVGQQSFQEDAVKIVKAYLGQDIPLDPNHAKLEQTYTRDLIRYLALTADKKAFRIIDVNPLKDAAAVTVAKELIKTLDQAGAETGMGFKKEPSREAGQVTLERYSLNVDPAAIMRMQGIDPAMLAPGGGNAGMAPFMAVLSALTKGIVMECAIKDNYFFSAIGPADATDDWIPALPFAAPTVTLDKKVGGLDPAAKPLLAAGELQITPFLKQLISMMPNVKPEHLALFDAKTDTVQFWTTRTADNTTIATFRVPANEVASIAKVAQNGQILQELVTTFFMTRMMPMMRGQPGGPAIQPPPNF